jgi:hypothetical protein
MLICEFDVRPRVDPRFADLSGQSLPIIRAG